MADELKKFLEDSKAYPDNTPIKIGDTEVPLGSLRALNATERTQLTEKIKEVEGQAKDLKERQTKVVELATKAQSAYDAAEEARRKAAEGSTRSNTADPFEDPWLSPVKTELAKRDKELESLKSQLSQALESVKNVVTIGLDDRWDREYSSLDFGKREKKPTRDELIEFATKNNLIDRHKIPSIRLAWENMNAADREAELREKARQEGIEEGKRLAMAARVTPPGVAGPGAVIASKEKAPAGDLGDLYSDAVKDPELRTLLEQAETHGIM
jgi:uncharacterized phage infection (PIP) family protein YhgE